MADLLYLGHGSLRLRSECGTVVYIDPFYDGDYSPHADLILVTHEHYDHNRTELVTLKPDGNVLRAADFSDGKTKTVKDLIISPVPAYNKNHKSGCLGYVVKVDGLTLYFAGDTSKTEHMSKMTGIDYAFLPTDGIYNMNAEEATVCAELIGARFSVPIHTERPEEKYKVSVANKFTPKGRLIILPGEEKKL